AEGVAKGAKAAEGVAKGAKAAEGVAKGAKVAEGVAKGAEAAEASVGLGAGVGAKVLSGVKGVAKGAKAFGSNILPWTLLLGGRSLQGASTAAGSVTAGAGEAVGHAVSALSQVPRQLGTASQSQIERFGKTPTAALGDVIGGLGSAAGQGITAVSHGTGNAISAMGNAVGSTVTDASDTMRLAKLQQQLNKRRLEEAAKWKSLDLNPATAKVVTQSMVGQR
ncbi:MAG TPA: hypothetical protein PLM50_02305, partial [Rectinema sp.]|nr:hypothetical protein [Rectinema sp.]